MTTDTRTLFSLLARFGVARSIATGPYAGCFTDPLQPQSSEAEKMQNYENMYGYEKGTTAFEGVFILRNQNAAYANHIVAKAAEAAKTWRQVPAPKRGEVVREIGNALRQHKASLARLITIEMGKILAEAEGEVQEMIDICDYACGLSRCLNGKVIPSERPGHMVLEVWNPLGVVGIITAFNFPTAVFGWNIAISLVCGNANVWKPSSMTPLVSLATNAIVQNVLARHGYAKAISSLILGNAGRHLVDDARVKLVSFTGSTRVGRHVSTKVAQRFGRTILELGGNNAIIVMDDADMNLVLPSIVFAAVGTCGQRCTTVRRLFVHEAIYDKVIAGVKKAYAQITIGNPLDQDTLMGPLVNHSAVTAYRRGILEAVKQGGSVLYGGTVRHTVDRLVEPTLIEIDPYAKCVQEELFAPVLYVAKFKTLKDVIQVHNNVPQGLSSSLFTRNIQHIGTWLSSEGSDCGIINVNAPTNGAEIGGAFGGEKETGGGRESGSDAWKQYMRRGTVTLNYSSQLPLAQGIHFG